MASRLLVDFTVGRPSGRLDWVSDLLDPPVRAWLSRHLPGIVHMAQLTGGYRNDNVLLVTDSGQRYVLRRYLVGNPCAVEVALASRLAGIVPVPEVVAADPTGEVAGRALLLSRFVPGVLASVALPTLAPHEAAQLGRAVGAVLARIGTVHFARPGFFAGPDLEPGPVGLEPTSGLPEFVDRCLRELVDRGLRELVDRGLRESVGNGVPDDGGLPDAGGVNAGGLTPAERDALRALAVREEPVLADLAGARQLVHSDFNPKNLLARQGAAGWTVSAVLDWEFAFSSTPLIDVGNMLRFDDTLPPAYRDGFVEGFPAAGGHLPANWSRVSRALDLFALADLLTRPPDHRYFRRGLAAIRRRLAGSGQPGLTAP